MQLETQWLVRFYVGGVALLHDVWAADEKAVQLFGGFTRLDGWGGWKPALGPASQEPASVWEVVLPLTEGAGVNAAEFAGFLRELFKQAAVLVVVAEVGVCLVGGLDKSPGDVVN